LRQQNLTPKKSLGIPGGAYPNPGFNRGGGVGRFYIPETTNNILCFRSRFKIKTKVIKISFFSPICLTKEAIKISNPKTYPIPKTWALISCRKKGVKQTFIFNVI